MGQLPITTVFAVRYCSSQSLSDQSILKIMETENLLAMLFGQMNEQQQLRFKQAIVAQTVFYVSQRLPVADRDKGERSFIELANKWIAEPTGENAEQAILATVFDRADGEVRHFEMGEYFLTPAEAAGADSGCDAVTYALKAAGDFQVVEAKQWQMATAWDILADRTPPSVESLLDD
jgi:hypothetical protein